MTPRSDIESRLAEAHVRLNAHRRSLVRAILDAPGETFFLSSRQLAHRYDVDPATIVRTIQALGYERFADFSTDLRQHFVSHLTPYKIMQAQTRAKRTVSDAVVASMDRDAENVKLLRESLHPARVIDLARRIHRARRVVIVGVDLAAALAQFLAYGLMPLGVAGEAPLGSSGSLYHTVRTLTSRDLLIAISFGRCLRDTVDAIVRARERGVPTFGITDSPSTPVSRYADASLIASISSVAVGGSYVAPMALLNTILAACAYVTPRRSLSLLRQSEAEYRTGLRWFDETRDAPQEAGDESTRNAAASSASRRTRPTTARGRGRTEAAKKTAAARVTRRSSNGTRSSAQPHAAQTKRRPTASPNNRGGH